MQILRAWPCRPPLRNVAFSSFLGGEIFQKSKKINVADFHEGSQKLHMCCKILRKANPLQVLVPGILLFRKLRRRKKFINPQRWPKVLIWKILPEQWLGVDRGTASR
jgi:hypothetical protein